METADFFTYFLKNIKNFTLPKGKQKTIEQGCCLISETSVTVCHAVYF